MRRTVTGLIQLLFSPYLRAKPRRRITYATWSSKFMRSSMPGFASALDKNSPQQVKGSGVVIDGRRILTNAHVVKYASQIYVQPNQSANYISARVEAITPGMDLAILKLDDESFFDKRGSPAFAEELPRVKDTSMSMAIRPAAPSSRLPKGSYRASSTPTITTRPPVCASRSTPRSTSATAAARRYPTANWSDLVFSLIQNAQNIGYLIPVEEIQLFLTTSQTAFTTANRRFMI